MKTLPKTILTAFFLSAVALPASATETQTNSSDDGFCANAPVICLVGGAWLTWQLLTMSEPSNTGTGSSPRGGYESPPPTTRDLDHTPDFGCIWGSNRYRTCH